MIEWSEVNKIQQEKINLEIQLAEFKKNNASEDKINEIKSEIIYLSKKIEKKLGSNELKRRAEISKKRSGIEENNIKAYLAFKEKYKKISKMKLAFTKMMNTIETIQKNSLIENEENVVKVKV